MTTCQLLLPSNMGHHPSLQGKLDFKENFKRVHSINRLGVSAPGVGGIFCITSTRIADTKGPKSIAMDPFAFFRSETESLGPK
ncbi:hypothetical protein DAPPUDRAFT_262706 [Daphnia pulex]|uniref:Uncharacterized protein n=1 Tax=Daphnia pulex TaxID=6669 RepID=E9HNJ3_DAPPU|nr:hypothetical protein DAPPUDRAFT_262706 [Daphnia pulex]|eukprot:EFX66701.1 hypothetical protein DAPPUDRAFT_262706 [Daphnia pulex]